MLFTICGEGTVFARVKDLDGENDRIHGDLLRLYLRLMESDAHRDSIRNRLAQVVQSYVYFLRYPNGALQDSDVVRTSPGPVQFFSSHSASSWIHRGPINKLSPRFAVAVDYEALRGIYRPR